MPNIYISDLKRFTIKNKRAFLLFINKAPFTGNKKKINYNFNINYLGNCRNNQFLLCTIPKQIFCIQENKNKRR